jgi:hypothetical protein
MTFKVSRHFIALAVLLSAAFVPQLASAHGNQIRIYPATGCAILDDAVAPSDTQVSADSLLRTRWGVIENQHETKAIPVICPVPRHDMGVRGLSVRIKFRTRVGSLHQAELDREFRCTLRNAGNPPREISTGTSALNGVIPGIAHSTSLTMNATNSAAGDDGGAFSLGCWLPPILNGTPSALIHYRVQEF